MKISFVITNTRRKSIAFVADTFDTFSLDEAVRAVKNKLFENVYIVSGTAGTYIRSNPDTKTNNNIDTLSVTGPQLIAIAQGILAPTLAIQTYVVRYLASIIRYVIDFWSPYIDLSHRPDIIGTLYNKGYGNPHAHPESLERGDQIAEEFYPLAKK